MCSLPGALANLQKMQLEHQHFADAQDLNSMWPVNAAPGEEGISEAAAGVLHVGHSGRGMIYMAWADCCRVANVCAHAGRQGVCMST